MTDDEVRAAFRAYDGPNGHAARNQTPWQIWRDAVAWAAIASSAPRQPVSAEAIKALRRLERAVDMHLGRSAWTQTNNLKGLSYSEAVRKELYAAHDEARATLSPKQAEPGKGEA